MGLGVGIDYALFLVTRHREFLARGMTIEESVGRSNATAGQAVIFAGGTVMIAILGLGVAGIPFMAAAGVAIAVTVLLMVTASVTLLPAFLGLAGHRVNGLRSSDRRAAKPAGISPRWERWGAHVATNAWRYAVGTYPVQVIDSGPDRDLKTIREVTFAAILKAQKRVWIASPYFVPDGGILDALPSRGNSDKNVSPRRTNV